VRLAVVQRIEDVPAEAVRMSAGGCGSRSMAASSRSPAAMRRRKGGKLRILRLSDGAAELAYAFADVIDIAPLTGAIRPAASPGEIGGVVLAGGEQVELLDPYWLFEQAGAHQPGAAGLICAIAAGDPWLENMLRPMVESLGYTVVPAGEGVHADIVIASAEAPAPPGNDGSAAAAPAGKPGREPRRGATPSTATTALRCWRRSGKHREAGVMAELLLIVRLAAAGSRCPHERLNRWSSWRG
jgi:hypothetical protein